MTNDPDQKAPLLTTPGQIGRSGLANEDFDAWRVSGAHAAKSSKIEAEPYDPRPQEDQARRNIAYCLIGLLVVLCLATFATVW